MEWISVKERLPRDEEIVLAHFQTHGMALCTFDGALGWSLEYPHHYEPVEEPTHWMPLPEPPKEEV